MLAPEIDSIMGPSRDTNKNIFRKSDIKVLTPSTVVRDGPSKGQWSISGVH